MTAFAFYAEPTFIVGDEYSDSRYLFIGAGYRAGAQQIAIGISCGGGSALIPLNLDEAQRLRDALTGYIDDAIATEGFES